MEIYDALVLSCSCNAQRYFINHNANYKAAEEETEYICHKCKSVVRVVGYRKVVLEKINYKYALYNDLKLNDGLFIKFKCKSCGAVVLRDYYTVQGCKNCGGSVRNVSVDFNVKVIPIDYDHDMIYRPWRQ